MSSGFLLPYSSSWLQLRTTSEISDRGDVMLIVSHIPVHAQFHMRSAPGPSASSHSCAICWSGISPMTAASDQDAGCMLGCVVESARRWMRWALLCAISPVRSQSTRGRRQLLALPARHDTILGTGTTNSNMLATDASSYLVRCRSQDSAGEAQVARAAFTSSSTLPTPTFLISPFASSLPLPLSIFLTPSTFLSPTSPPIAPRPLLPLSSAALARTLSPSCSNRIAECTRHSCADDPVFPKR
ncbi:hypothetical protein HDK90DRAFT_540982, partial [Phyllosticta capitalensis]